MVTTFKSFLVVGLVLFIAVYAIALLGQGDIAISSQTTTVDVEYEFSKVESLSYWELEDEFVRRSLAELADGEVVLKEHSVEKHDTDAISAQSCLTNPNRHLFFNPTTNRYGVVCFIQETGRWGTVILEKIADNFEEVTSFTKNKMTRVDQVIQYMKNSGYKLINF